MNNPALRTNRQEATLTLGTPSTQTGTEQGIEQNNERQATTASSTGERPAARATAEIARQFSNSSPAQRTDILHCGLKALMFKCRLQPHLVHLTNLAMPARENPFKQLYNAQNINELLACNDGLVQMLGTNQHNKMSKPDLSPAEQARVPARLVKTFVEKAQAGLQTTPHLSYPQRRKLAAFAAYLARFVASHPYPDEILKQLSTGQAQFFLAQLPAPNGMENVLANEAVTNIRQKLALQIVDEDGRQLQHLPLDLRNNQPVVELAVANHIGALAFAHPNLQNNLDILRLQQYRSGFSSLRMPVSQEDKNNPLIVLAAVRHNGFELRHAGAEQKNDRKIVMAAVRQNGWILEYANAEHKNDREIAMAAVQQSGWALAFTSTEIKKDFDVVMAAVQQNGWALEHANVELQNNPAIVMIAVQQRGKALRFASTSLQNDPAIVMAAVQQCGVALRYASPTLRNDRDIVIEAIREDVDALEYASVELQNDPEILEVVEQQNARRNNQAA